MPDGRDNLKQTFAGKRILVTGGLGFIGSTLAVQLVELGAQVTLLDSLIPEHGGNVFNIEGIRDEVRLNISDMRDLNSLNVLVQDKDYVFHLAGQVSHGDSMRDPHNDLGVNCVATINLVEACRHYSPEAKLLYTSTRQVYGVPKELPVTEEHTTIPVDVNGINKLAAEYYHLLYDRTYGLRSTVLRLTNTYGPRQQIRSNRQGFVGIFIREALRKNKIKVFGTGEQVRDFNYVDDVVQAMLLAMQTEACFGRVWNLGAPKYYSVLEMVETLKEYCPLEYEVVPFPDERGMIDIGDYYGDYSAFKEATGWEPETDLPAGLQRTVASYRDQYQHYWK